MTEELRRLALGFIREEQARDEIERADRALGWIVMLEDLDFGSKTLYGTFEDPVDAIAWSEKFRNELNECVGENEEGWQTTVFPLQPLD